MKEVCKVQLELVETASTNFDDELRLMVYQGHIPSGTGMVNLAHYAQIYQSEKFELYNYGQTLNQEKYGQDTPPEVDLQSVKEADVPMAIY